MDHPANPVPQFLHDGDFLGVLEGARVRDRAASGGGAARFAAECRQGGIATEGTTVLAIKYKDGVLVAGDRRATAGQSGDVRARRETDQHRLTSSILAIAGVPALAFEIARVLEHSFKYYQRSQLQEMSTAGKVRSLSKLLKENLPLTLQGVGMVVPVFATYERADGLDERRQGVFLRRARRAIRGRGLCRQRLGVAGGAQRLALPEYLGRQTAGANSANRKWWWQHCGCSTRRRTATPPPAATTRNPTLFPIVRTITKDGIREIGEAELARAYRSEG